MEVGWQNWGRTRDLYTYNKIDKNELVEHGENKNAKVYKQEQMCN